MQEIKKFLCPIRRGALIAPKSIAIKDGLTTYSYEELDMLISSLAAWIDNNTQNTLAALNLSSFETIMLLFASMRSGSSLFLLSDRLPTIKQKEYLAFLKASPFSFPSHLPRAFSDGIIHADKSSLFLLTSGSSKQKIVHLRFPQIYHNATAVNRYFSLSEKDQWSLTLPLYHVSGLGILLRIFLARGTLLLPATKNQFFGNYLSFVPTQLHRLVEGKITINRSNIDAILVGGAKLGKSLYERAIKLGLPVHITYGLTETASQVITTNKPHWQNGIPFLGKPLSGSEMKVQNREIYTRGKTLFEGYKNDTRKLTDGWFATGDIGLFSAEHGFACLGRADRMFISGGENIHPEVIERVLLSIPGIYAALVVPEENDEFGALPMAYIDYDKEIISLDQCRDFLRDYIPNFMVPKKIFPWGMAPKKELYKEHNLSVSSL